MIRIKDFDYEEVSEITIEIPGETMDKAMDLLRIRGYELCEGIKREEVAAEFMILGLNTFIEELESEEASVLYEDLEEEGLIKKVASY
jgi:hypothetical protein